MKIYSLIVLAFFLSLYSCNEADVRVTIDFEDVILDQFVGNGVQWSAYPHADSDEAEWGHLMTDGKWQIIYERLDQMNPSIVRVIDQANWRYLRGFDGSGNPIIDYNSQEVKSLEKILMYCQNNHIDVLLGEWGCPYKVHDVELGYSGMFKGANDEKWLGLIVDFLSYLIEEKGYTCIKYYNLINEPNGTWASTDGNWDEWSEGVQLLSEGIENAGLADYISIAGPDAVAHYDHPNSQYSGRAWVQATADQLDSNIGIYDIHAYTSYEKVHSGRFAEYYKPLARIADSMKKPIIFGELGFEKEGEVNRLRIEADKYASDDSQMAVYDFQYGIDMADAAIQLMGVGFAGAIAWSLDYAMHTKGDTGDSMQIKRWGMWNILGSELCDNPEDENIRPWYYAWSLLCSYFPQGAKIVRVNINQADDYNMLVRGVGAVHKEGFSIAIVNNSDEEVRIVLENPDKASLQRILYHNGLIENRDSISSYVSNQSLAVRKEVKLILPASSLSLITSNIIK